MKSDKAIEDLLLKGDSSTIQAIYEQYGPKVIGHVINKGGSEEDGKEVFQQSLLSAYLNIANGNYKSNGKFGHYLIKIAMNTWSNKLKEKHKRKFVNWENIAHDIEDRSIESITEKITFDKTLEALDKVLKQVNTDCQKLIRQYYYKKVKLKDIALEAGLEAGTLRQQLLRCRNQIKNLLLKIGIQSTT